jgi:hypothetical protein
MNFKQKDFSLNQPHHYQHQQKQAKNIKMDTVLVKSIISEGEKCITIDRVDLLFVNTHNLNTKTSTVEYPKLKNKFSTATPVKYENHNCVNENIYELDCGKVVPTITNIEIEKINRKLEKILSKTKNIITLD